MITYLALSTIVVIVFVYLRVKMRCDRLEGRIEALSDALGYEQTGRNAFEKKEDVFKRRVEEAAREMVSASEWGREHLEFEAAVSNRVYELRSEKAASKGDK